MNYDYDCVYLYILWFFLYMYLFFYRECGIYKATNLIARVASSHTTKKEEEEKSVYKQRVIMAINIASRWSELSGDKNWKDLLNPLDIDLRRYIIHYGERAAAAGDLFNNDKESSGYGRSLCPEDELFSRAGLENGNIFKYSVTTFFDVTASETDSAWFGYVAVSTDKGNVGLGRRDILVAWRGTLTDAENKNDFDVFPASASELFGADTNAKVHAGFLNLYTSKNSNSLYSAREQVNLDEAFL